MYEDGQEFALAALPGCGAVAQCRRVAAVIGAGSVSDPDDVDDSLVVTTIVVPTGLTVTNINVLYASANAMVAAVCSATEGAKTVVLQVRNSGYVTATANLFVNVIANTAPILGACGDTTVRTGESKTVSSSPPPADNGTVTAHRPRVGRLHRHGHGGLV